MIELPEYPAPNGATPALVDFGNTLTPSLGGPDLRLNRMGSRYRIQVTWPPMPLDDARVFISRLQQAKSEGLRLPYPLAQVSQGSPGSPVVDGADQAGTTLNLRGLQPGYTVKEGFWLSIVKDGQHYLHNARGVVRVSNDGLASLPIWPMLRTDFADGAAVHLGKPMIEGLPEGDETSWTIPVERLVALSVVIKETA